MQKYIKFYFSMLHLPLKIVQRLDMPQAFAGDGAEGQGAEKVDEKDFRYVKELSFAERFQLPTVAPIIDGGFGVAGQGDNILHGHDILIFAAAVWHNSRAFVSVHPQAILWRASLHNDRRTIP